MVKKKNGIYKEIIWTVNGRNLHKETALLVDELKKMAERTEDNFHKELLFGDMKKSWFKAIITNIRVLRFCFRHHWRLGQFWSNFNDWNGKQGNAELFYISDERLLKEVKKFAKTLSGKTK